MISAIIYAIGGIIEALIGLRFLLRLLGANPNAGFVQWIYDWSTPLVAPFAGIFGQQATITGEGVVTTSVFDWSAMIAFIIYGIVVYILVRVFARAGA
jgi:uncharacterized protein YggT (Ycf19 family)